MYGASEKIKIASRISEMRSAKKITQEQMADLINMSYSTYLKIEHGRQNLTIKHLFNIAEVLNIPADVILFGKLNDKTFEDYIRYSKFFNIDNLTELKNCIQDVIDFQKK